MYDVIVIGGGAAGLAASLYAARFSLNVACIAKELGGTGNEAHKVDNWIGTPGISGIELMKNFVDHVKNYDVPLLVDIVKDVNKLDDCFEVICENEVYKSKTIILALGMKHRELGVPGEKEFAGKGVHYCYTCDGPFYKNKIVAVVGGSDSAALGALMLKDHAEKVYVLYRKDKLRAEPVSAKLVYDDSKIEVVHNVNVVEVLGDEKGMTKVKLDNGNELKLDGLFVEIGHLPLNEIPKKLGAELDEKGFVKVDNEYGTNVDGFYAAGDITNVTSLKQFITSASQGSIAAQSVYQNLSKK
jgi:thioredoxin reductase (NADPH)